jgi:hypothetical protein
LPAREEEHWLRVRLPFRADAGEAFHCLYQPPLSHLDGWTEHPDEISRSAVVRCTLIDVARVHDDAADVRVAVSDVWSVDGIGALFPAEHRTEVRFWDRFATQTMHAARWNQFLCVGGSFEGDVATLALFETRGECRHLILEGYSSHHADFIFVGNSPLDSDGERVLDDMLNRLGLTAG